MKIIFANRYFSPDESATSRVVSSLAFALARAGWDVHAITGRRFHDDTSRTLPAHEIVHGVNVHRVATSSFGRGRLVGRAVDYATFHMRAFWALLRIARRGDACIVCTDPPLLSVTALIPVLATRSRLFNWLHDLFPEVAMELGVIRRTSPLARLILYLRDLSLKKAFCNVVPMGRMVELLRRRQIPASTLAVVHHWSNGDEIRPIRPGANALRTEWGLRDKLVVGYSGNLGRAHEFDTLLDAATQLKERPDIVFLFVGGGYQKAFIEAEIQRRGLTNVVMKPLQSREKLSECLGAADIHIVSLLPILESYIVPSKFYGIAAAGRPTLFIGDPQGEIGQMLRQGRCGFAVRIGDAAGLVSRIEKLSASAWLRTTMGANARHLFEQRFLEEVGVSAWRALIERKTEHRRLDAPATVERVST